jgi:hypothetical protein
MPNHRAKEPLKRVGAIVDAPEQHRLAKQQDAGAGKRPQGGRGGIAKLAVMIGMDCHIKRLFCLKGEK